MHSKPHQKYARTPHKFALQSTLIPEIIDNSSMSAVLMCVKQQHTAVYSYIIQKFQKCWFPFIFRLTSGRQWTRKSATPAAHPNARFCTPIANLSASVRDSNWDNPRGVPIDAIIFGGRRPEGARTLLRRELEYILVHRNKLLS